MIMMKRVSTLAALSAASACGGEGEGDLAGVNLAERPSTAIAADGRYISWREHRIDDEELGGIELRGGDGLIMADLDRDGFLDIVSVHESDVTYDGVPDGHVRIAFGSADPDVWELVTLAEGEEAGAAEDVAAADADGDGDLDVVVAAELAHIIYFENPGSDVRKRRWPRVIPEVASNRGSFIRVFFADFDADGRPEVVSPNKGAQDPTQAAQEPKEVSIFDLGTEPLSGNWEEHVLTRFPWPINAQPTDLDGDGDPDVVAGSVAQGRMLWFENVGRDFQFVEHGFDIVMADGSESPNVIHGFNMDFVDLSNDGRPDILTWDSSRLIGINLLWLEQPAAPGGKWMRHTIGDLGPDAIVGFVAADIDGDGDDDVIAGGYSLGSRTEDGGRRPDASMGRLAWFENPGGASDAWIRHDFSRRERGMFDKFVPRDMDGDGDVDFVTTRGNSGVYDGVIWLEQVRTAAPVAAFTPARSVDSPEAALP
jgi:hypothetical protein